MGVAGCCLAEEEPGLPLLLLLLPPFPEGELVRPKLSKRLPSSNTTVPPALRACSKSMSILEVLLLAFSDAVGFRAGLLP